MDIIYNSEIRDERREKLRLRRESWCQRECGREKILGSVQCRAVREILRSSWFWGSLPFKSTHTKPSLSKTMSSPQVANDVIVCDNGTGVSVVCVIILSVSLCNWCCWWFIFLSLLLCVEIGFCGSLPTPHWMLLLLFPSVFSTDSKLVELGFHHLYLSHSLSACRW